MHSLEQLVFAQRFPFTNAARKIVLEQNLSLQELPEPVIERAELMARHAFSGKEYVFEVRASDLLMQEILAFPVAKIIVSIVGEPGLYRAFSSMVSGFVYHYLSSEREQGKIALSLASELGIQVDFPEQKSFFVSLPLKDFLSVPINEDPLKLVNQFVNNGLVFLDLNSFQKYLRQKCLEAVLSSLPVPTRGIPKRLQGIAMQLKQASREREQRLFSQAFKGRVAPEAFPDCIASMYGQLASGQKLPHMANFTLATFLNSIGMPKQNIMALFKKAPNFSERTSSYQVDRIAKQNYSPPSCEKIRAYGYCPNQGCRAKHPLSLYRARMRHAKDKKQVEK